MLSIALNASFLQAAESKFKFTVGGNVGKIPFEINRVNQNTKIFPGIKINSWILSPNFSSFIGDKKNSNFTEVKDFKESLYIKFNFKF